MGSGEQVEMITVDDRLVEVPEGQMFARRWKVPESTASPIIMLHESLGSVEVWRSFPQQIAEASGRTVIAYDRLGYGQSSVLSELPPRDFLEVEGTIRLSAVARAFGYSRYVALGHSVGGVMALKAAALGDECDAVISIAAHVQCAPGAGESIIAAREALTQPNQFGRLQRYHGERAGWVLDSWTETWLSPEFQSWTLTGLEQITCPVLTMHGNSDEFGSQEAPDVIAASVSGPVELVRLQAGHVPHIETPEPVLETISAFLRTHTTS